MLGHTKLYAKVLDTKVSEDMAPLMGKFVAQHTKAYEVTESKISAEITLIREKYNVVPAMEEAP